MKFNEFAEKIKGKYSGKFPKGTCIVRQYVCLGKSITIDCYFDGKKENQNTPSISSNDMFRITFNISLHGKFDYDNDELPEELVMEAWANSYLIKPDNTHLCYESRKIPYRKTKGSAEKLITTADKFFGKLYDMVLEDFNNGNIHDNYIELVKENLGGKNNGKN